MTHPTPNPGMFRHRRISSVPPRRTQNGVAQHAFPRNVIPQGDRNRFALVDAGILFSLGASTRTNAVARFHALYESRASTTDAVRDEVRRKALATTSEPRGLQPAAVRARNFFLTGARLAVDEIQMSQELAARLQIVHGQLRSYEAARRQPGAQVHGLVLKHAGEATLIVAASRRPNPLLLTNDGGASYVASRQTPSVPSLHFGHLLRELVCNAENLIQLADVVADYEAACTISGIPADVKPGASTDSFGCSRDSASGKCAICDQV